MFEIILYGFIGLVVVGTVVFFVHTFHWFEKSKELSKELAEELGFQLKVDDGWHGDGPYIEGQLDGIDIRLQFCMKKHGKGSYYHIVITAELPDSIPADFEIRPRSLLSFLFSGSSHSLGDDSFDKKFVIEGSVGSPFLNRLSTDKSRRLLAETFDNYNRAKIGQRQIRLVNRPWLLKKEQLLEMIEDARALGLMLSRAADPDFLETSASPNPPEPEPEPDPETEPTPAQPDRDEHPDPSESEETTAVW